MSNNFVTFAGNSTKLEETSIKRTALKCTPRTLLMRDGNEQIAKKCSKMGSGVGEEETVGCGQAKK